MVDDLSVVVLASNAVVLPDQMFRLLLLRKALA